MLGACELLSGFGQASSMTAYTLLTENGNIPISVFYLEEIFYLDYRRNIVHDDINFAILSYYYGTVK